MFSLQGPVNGSPQNMLKRPREDEPEVGIGGTVGFTEHRNKRIHALPLRTSPKARRRSPPPNFFQPSFGQQSQPHNSITPPQSDSEDVANSNGQPMGYGQSWNAAGAPQHPSLPMVNQAVDMDMDMDTEYVVPSPQRPLPGGQNHLVPGAFQPDAVGTTITSRMPTPIQPSFAAQVRGNNWGGAAGNIMQSGPGAGHTVIANGASGLDAAVNSHVAPAPFQDQSVPRSLDYSHGWNTLQTRSLPSPISESGGEDMGSPGMVLDGVQMRSNSMDNSHSLPPRSYSALNLHTLHPLLTSEEQSAQLADMNRPASNRDSGIDVNPPTASSPVSMDTDPPATPSPRKGHSRSRHTLNSWTIHPGMKKSFSIGYRADCEKCRNKVPGHFNHIIVS